jgi:hypothetical protein
MSEVINEIVDAGITELIKAPFAHRLESLNLDSTGITDRSVELLVLPNVFVSLNKLNLRYNENIHDQSVGTLLDAPFAGKLRSLNIDETGITKEAKDRLIKARIGRKIHRS